MSDAQKLSFQASLNRVGQARAADAIQRLGKSLPCSVTAISGALVTVKFELTTEYTLPKIQMPVIGSEYIRLPVKVGDKGIVMACDANIGHISGLGGATPPDLTQPGNLSALIFVPIGNKFWSAVADPTAVTIYGAGGVTLKDEGGQASMTLKPGTVVILAAGSAVSAGVVNQDCLCSYTGAKHPMASATIKVSL